MPVSYSLPLCIPIFSFPDPCSFAFRLLRLSKMRGRRWKLLVSLRRRGCFNWSWSVVVKMSTSLRKIWRKYWKPGRCLWSSRLWMIGGLRGRGAEGFWGRANLQLVALGNVWGLEDAVEDRSCWRWALLFLSRSLRVHSPQRLANEEEIASCTRRKRSVCIKPINSWRWYNHSALSRSGDLRRSEGTCKMSCIEESIGNQCCPGRRSRRKSPQLGFAVGDWTNTSTN